MPLDHYVSQVHLRNFYSPVLGNRMYAIRKADLEAFTANSQDVCRIMNGSTNPYLREPRAIEEFLSTVEPNYNAALEKLVAGKIDKECIYTIAGFVAYVIVCSPAGMRINSEPIKSAVESSLPLLEAHGQLSPRPAELEGEAIGAAINPKFPQALGIVSIWQNVGELGNSKWEILHNDSEDSPFFTSDFPVAIEKTDDLRILNKIIPLAPNLAIRIRPDSKLERDKLNLSFTNFSYHRRKLGQKEIERLNRLIVQCAEETVFYRDDLPWIRPFVSRNRHYGIEKYVSTIPTPTSEFLISQPRIVARTLPDDTGTGKGIQS